MMFRSVSARGSLGLFVASLAVMLAACSSGKDPLYRSDKGSGTTAERRTLEVPPDLITPGRDNRVQTPPVGRPAPVTASSQVQQPRPDAAAVSTTSPDVAGNIRIERAGSQRWLVLVGTPQVVWPKVRKFWEDMGFTIASDAPDVFVMETDWAEKRSRVLPGVLENLALIRAFSSSSERDKYRTRLESGTTPGTLEVYVTHRGLEETDMSTKNNNTAAPMLGWVPRPSDPSLELEMLRRMMVSFGVEEAAAQAAVVQQTADRARLAAATGGGQQLVVDGALSTVWRQVGLGLDRVGMVVEDRDRAQSFYLVRYITDENAKKDGSWFSWMAFWRSSDKKPDTDQFRIVVTADGQKSIVRVQDKAGAPASSASANQILTLLYNELK